MCQQPIANQGALQAKARQRPQRLLLLSLGWVQALECPGFTTLTAILTFYSCGLGYFGNCLLPLSIQQVCKRKEKFRHNELRAERAAPLFAIGRWLHQACEIVDQRKKLENAIQVTAPDAYVCCRLCEGQVASARNPHYQLC